MLTVVVGGFNGGILMFKKLIALLLTSVAVFSAQAGCCGCCGGCCRPRVARVVRPNNNNKKPVVQTVAPQNKKAVRRICRGGCCSCCR